MKPILLNILTLLIHLFVPERAYIQTTPGELTYRIHSVYIYNFMKEVQWPPDYNGGDFTIGILGESPIENELRKMANARSASSRKVTVKVYKSASEIEKNCHIVYLDADHSDELSGVLQKAKGSPLLVITYKEGAAKFGSLINFVAEKGKPRFEMNLTAFEKSRLKYTQQLKTVAITVN